MLFFLDLASNAKEMSELKHVHKSLLNVANRIDQIIKRGNHQDHIVEPIRTDSGLNIGEWEWFADDNDEDTNDKFGKFLDALNSGDQNAIMKLREMIFALSK